MIALRHIAEAGGGIARVVGGGGNRTPKPVSCFVIAWQSAAFHAGRRDEGGRLKAECRNCWFGPRVITSMHCGTVGEKNAWMARLQRLSSPAGLAFIQVGSGGWLCIPFK